jgi:hypothetical protein
MDRDIQREFERLHRELKELKKQQGKSTWVPAEWILEITGWDKRRLQTAREQGIVETKPEGRGYRYKLESIPEVFIKQAS